MLYSIKNQEIKLQIPLFSSHEIKKWFYFVVDIKIDL